jgi:hypothetical protein
MKKSLITDRLQIALQAQPLLDIPAKGRIAHHIRTGRLERAIALCAAGHLFLLKKIWIGARPLLLDQLNQLKQVEALLRREAGYGMPNLILHQSRSAPRY